MTRKLLLNLPSLIYHLSTLAAAFVSSITIVSQAASNHADALVVILLISCVGLKKKHFSYASRKEACNSNFTLRRAALCCAATDQHVYFSEMIHWNQRIESKITAGAVTNVQLISFSNNNYNCFSSCTCSMWEWTVCVADRGTVNVATRGPDQKENVVFICNNPRPRRPSRLR